MEKPITTRTHGQLDLLTAGALLLLPRLFGRSHALRALLTTAGAAKLTYALLTRHEVALLKIVPMKTHLKLDCLAGATVAAAPFLLGESSSIAASLCTALGVFDIAVAPLTQTRMQPSAQPHQPAPRPPAERRSQQPPPQPSPSWQMPSGRAPRPQQQPQGQAQNQSRNQPENQSQNQPAPPQPQAAAPEPAARHNPPEQQPEPQHQEPSKGGLDHVEGAGKGPMEGVVWPSRTR